MITRRHTLTWLLVASFAGACGGGCATTRKAYYNAWEKFGYAKRERHYQAAESDQYVAEGGLEPAHQPASEVAGN